MIVYFDVMILDLFAGCGGWDEGLNGLGRNDILGIDKAEIACDTARAAGHRRHRKFIERLDPLGYEGIQGMCGSPPCTVFTTAGDGKGRQDVPLLLEAMDKIARGNDVDRAISRVRNLAIEQDSALVLEPVRWALALKPQWIALEQVPAILPIWQAMAETLTDRGYHTWSGYINAEQYGVPQTRKRAIFLAHTSVEVYRPVPQHSVFDVKIPDRLVGPKWVSMEEALSLAEGLEMRSAYTRGGNLDVRNTRACKYPSLTVTGNIGKNKFQPIEGEGRWSRETPRAGRLLTLSEAGMLQSFRPDYPWQGTRTEAAKQIGDAVPPLMAGALLKQCLES